VTPSPGPVLRALGEADVDFGMSLVEALEEIFLDYYGEVPA